MAEKKKSLNSEFRKLRKMSKLWVVHLQLQEKNNCESQLPFLLFILWQKQKTEFWNVNTELRDVNLEFGEKSPNCHMKSQLWEKSEIWIADLFFDHFGSDELEEDTGPPLPDPSPTLRPNSRSNFQPESGIKRLWVLLQEPNVHTHTYITNIYGQIY